MKFFDPYKERRKTSRYYRIYEILWKENILKISEDNNMEEYHFISFDIADIDFDENSTSLELANSLKGIFYYWCGTSIPNNIDEYLKLANNIKDIIKKEQ